MNPNAVTSPVEINQYSELGVSAAIYTNHDERATAKIWQRNNRIDTKHDIYRYRLICKLEKTACLYWYFHCKRIASTFRTKDFGQAKKQHCTNMLSKIVL
jgi:hypothetical protein